MNRFKLYLELGKVRITVMVTLSVITGYILHKHTLDLGAILPVIGVFFLAVASSALNHIQERKHDKYMERTADRPLPSGKISLTEAILFVAIIFISGSLMIYLSSGLIPLLLGWGTLFWYNAIYTPLKRVTQFAVIIGALIGALPPMIGYAAAGGNVLNIDILTVAFFFFIWQVPHFILLVIKLGKQYESAGFKSLTSIFSENQLKRLVLTWVIGTAFSAFLMPAFGVITDKIIILIISVSIALIIISVALVMSNNQKLILRRTFMSINIYLLIIMIFIIIESV